MSGIEIMRDALRKLDESARREKIERERERIHKAEDEEAERLRIAAIDESPLEFYRVDITEFSIPDIAKERKAPGGRAVDWMPMPREREGDLWYDAIVCAIKEHIQEHGEIPNKNQVSSRMFANPPHGHGITVGKHNGDDALLMQGIKPVGKQALKGRISRILGKH